MTIAIEVSQGSVVAVFVSSSIIQDGYNPEEIEALVFDHDANEFEPLTEESLKKVHLGENMSLVGSLEEIDFTGEEEN